MTGRHEHTEQAGLLLVLTGCSPCREENKFHKLMQKRVQQAKALVPLLRKPPAILLRRHCACCLPRTGCQLLVDPALTWCVSLSGKARRAADRMQSLLQAGARTVCPPVMRRVLMRRTARHSSPQPTTAFASPACTCQLTTAPVIAILPALIAPGTEQMRRTTTIMMRWRRKSTEQVLQHTANYGGRSARCHTSLMSATKVTKVTRVLQLISSSSSNSTGPQSTTAETHDRITLSSMSVIANRLAATARLCTSSYTSRDIWGASLRMLAPQQQRLLLRRSRRCRMTALQHIASGRPQVVCRGLIRDSTLRQSGQLSGQQPAAATPPRLKAPCASDQDSIQPAIQSFTSSGRASRKIGQLNVVTSGGKTKIPEPIGRRCTASRSASW